jgi:hypothetical protein
MPPEFPLNYTYRAVWDLENREYNATCLEFPEHFAVGLTAHDAVVAMEKLVDELLVERAEFNQDPPKSLADQRYSGKFLIRTSRALHARLMVESTEQGVTFNHWVACKLADRPRPPSFDDLFN